MGLIDADDFGNRMYHEAFEKDSDLQKWDSGCWIRYKLFENVLREQPTVQPEEAIPVSWIEGKITRFIEMDNAFSGLTVSIMRAMVNEWKREQKGGAKCNT